jgi:chromosome segregation ATPase
MVSFNSLEQIRQQKAMTAGLINLKTHSNKTIKIFNEYHSKAQKLFADQKTLINSVPEDLDSLQKIPIHVAFALDQKTLGDFIKPEQMLIYQKHCQNTREFLLSNTQQLLNNVQDLKVAFGSEELSELKFDDKLQNELKEIQKVCEKVIQKQQILMRDLTRVESLFTEINQDLDDQESRSKYEAIAHLYKIHYEEYIPEITKYDRFLRDSVLNFTDSKTQMNATVKQRLLDIAYYESISKSIIYNVDGLEDALQEQAPKYKYLKIHYRFGPSWAALLVEIVRRKEFNAFSINVTKEMARVLDELRQKEERIRGRFRENYCNDLWYPHVSGINDGPPVCRFHIKCPDDQLPDITMEEVDLFEKAFAMKEGNGIGFSQRMYKKLQEIRPDLEKTAVNFDNILKRSSLFERIRSLEKENQELKQKVSQKPEGNSIILAPSIHRESSRDRNSIRDSRERKESFKKDETIKAYELRIKSLEQIIHDKFHKESENEIEELRQENRDLVEHLQIEEQKVKETDRDIVEIGQKLNEITQEMKNQKLKSTQIENNFTKVLIEVFEHLDFCSSIVRNESIEKCVYKDVDFLNLRTKMKDVEDLLSNQMNGSKQSMHTESLVIESLNI